MAFTTLISVDDLARSLSDAAVIVFDCRHDLAKPEAGAAAYAQSHIPGARFAHSDRDLSAPVTGRNGRHPLVNPRAFAEWLGRMGVDTNKHVVGYDASGGVYAARLWWMLRWLGHRDVAVLDGGWDAWIKAGHPSTAEVPTPAPARFSGAANDSSVDAAYVQARLHCGDMVLIDARSNDRFHGKNETIDPVAGHIPGAVNRFYRDNLDAQGKFKPAAELRVAFNALIGSASPLRVVHQCGSGVSACNNLLAMEVAGLAGSRLYPGSWSEWIADPSRPIATD